VFGLDGRTRQVVKNLDRPNNVDVEYGLTLGGRRYDIAVCTERLKHRLRVFAISPDGNCPTWHRTACRFSRAKPATGANRWASPYTNAPRTARFFAIVGRKSGPPKGYLHVYRLHAGKNGTLAADFVKAFGAYSGKKEIESICVDDALGYVYYSDERVCVRKYPANPNSPFFGQELGTFGRENRVGDHEGIALYSKPDRIRLHRFHDQIPAADGGTRILLSTSARANRTIATTRQSRSSSSTAARTRPTASRSRPRDSESGSRTVV
jgi:3-phytase